MTEKKISVTVKADNIIILARFFSKTVGVDFLEMKKTLTALEEAKKELGLGNLGNMNMSSEDLKKAIKRVVEEEKPPPHHFY
ncbi:MAG: hypothetical protein JW812_02525 [Alphaproteobacteria bacterium]|nr:hypothetical protein [Alphaproteobacteria bacterium]MBN2779565.1 hypothetical protein [Alphaproteobacteria bacterium]